jgi:hypothetical protein
LAQVRQKRGETVAEYIHRFKDVRNCCYSSRISEKEAISLVGTGLAKLIKDVAFTMDFNSLAHMVHKLTAYEQYRPELYVDKFKRNVNVVDAPDSEEDGEEQEVALAEWV